jgi:hypothetical protein
MTPMSKGELRPVLPGFGLLGIQLRVVSGDGDRHCFGRGGQAVWVGLVAKDGLPALDSLHCAGDGVLWKCGCSESLRRRLGISSQEVYRSK